MKVPANSPEIRLLRIAMMDQQLMLPEVLAVTDLNRENVFSVPLSQSVPAMDAPEDLLHEEMEKIEAHQAYAKNLFWTSQNTLKDHHYIATIPDAGTLQIGSDIAAQSERITAHQDETRRRVRTNRDLIEKEQLPRELMQSADTMPPEVLKSLAQLKNEITAEEIP